MPKEVSSKNWHVTHDESVLPQRVDFALIMESKDSVAKMVEGIDPLSKEGTKKLKEAMKSKTKTVKEMWGVGGMELVSKVLTFRYKCSLSFSN